MEAEYLDNVLKSLNEKQVEMKNKLGEALLNTTDKEEKEQIQKMIDFNEKIEIAIANKDLNSLQKLYSDGNFN